jgi:hypothetical protein
MDNLEVDIERVAKHALASTIDYALIIGDTSHEDYPEIGAGDWNLVQQKIKTIVESMRPSVEDYQESYTRLTERAG